LEEVTYPDSEDISNDLKRKEKGKVRDNNPFWSKETDKSIRKEREAAALIRHKQNMKKWDIEMDNHSKQIELRNFIHKEKRRLSEEMENEINEAFNDNPMPQDGTETEDEWNARMSRLSETIESKYFDKMEALDEDYDNRVHETRLGGW
tara:strand:- start:14487 stop:14933 length:447 start_codon:yes stop_codon:yes gene_type:complete